MERRRFKQSVPLSKRLEGEVARLKDLSGSMPEGPDRDVLVARTLQVEAAVDIEACLSPALPKPLR